MKLSYTFDRQQRASRGIISLSSKAGSQCPFVCIFEHFSAFLLELQEILLLAFIVCNGRVEVLNQFDTPLGCVVHHFWRSIFSLQHGSCHIYPKEEVFPLEVSGEVEEFRNSW